MKSILKRAVLIGLCLTLAIAGLSGCGLLASMGFDAQAHVKGNIDAQYLNTYTADYLESVSGTEEKMNEMYQSGLEVEAEFFVNYFSVVLDKCPEDTKNRIIALYDEIYSHSKYEVGKGVKSGDDYLVSVTVYPIDIVENVINEDMTGYNEAWLDKIYEEDLTEEEAETLWVDGIIDMFEARMASIGYLEPQTISVQVVKDADGKYVISSNDYDRIDALIISYPA